MGKQFFSYDPSEGFDLWDTEEEARNAAQRHLDASLQDGCWCFDEDEMQEISWGRITESAQVTKRTLRPDNVDEEGLDKDGNYWSYGIDEMIDYKILPPSSKPMPRIVCLCGSTRFWREFQKASLRETMEGRIVLSIGAASGTDDDHFGNLPPGEYARIKAELDELHKRKIDLADEVLVLNVGGYIGESTRSEVDYALAHNKSVRWLETYVAPLAVTLSSSVIDALRDSVKGD